MTKKLTVVFSIIFIAAIIGCATTKVKVVELENKGTSMNVATPDWIKLYTAQGITKVQAQSEFKDKYCIIGEETGVNKQFVLAWADNFSAQQRIGAMLRTNIASEYQARVQGAAQSVGGANSSTAAGTSSGEYNQQINNTINAVVNVSFSGAQREADWWSLRRRYDPDEKDVFSDEYTAYVLYTIPKSQLNQQVARALETSVSKDSVLYDITIEMARQILQKGMANWGAVPTASTASTSAMPVASTVSQEYKIGDIGPAGGLIFYDKGDNSNGWRYLEAAPVEAEFQARWSAINDFGETRVTNTQKTVGSGKMNTQLIVETFIKTSGEWDTAAQKANDLVFGVFDDWFLPSIDELDQIYGNLKRRNLGHFKDDRYWSSSLDDSRYAHSQNLKDGTIGRNNIRKDASSGSTSSLYVRPIRQVVGK